ncbi:hypothetical protein BH23ACT5_BH23ACT5_02060 [soil metagenome]
MNDATIRAELHSRLSEVLGIDHAGTLMAYLPGDEPATKSDLALLKNDVESVRRELAARMDGLDDRMDGLDHRMERFEEKLDAKMDSFHHALLAQGRTYVIASVGSILTTATLVAGITRLL